MYDCDINKDFYSHINLSSTSTTTFMVKESEYVALLSWNMGIYELRDEVECVVGSYRRDTLSLSFFSRQSNP
ncbi:hypothetical protein VNO78_31795 [Psophocarpus tetragonolobus]|uniref:Uncharacterized protein n=1 Tax=Psophocarpus tetragonolobus TaxID=3891 RepID=A0AAN9RYP6_PSOTE